MTDFKRLIDEVDSEFARAVLESGRSMEPNAARRRRVLTALGVGLVIGTTHKLSLAALSTWQKLAFVGGVACVGAGGALTYSRLTAPAPVVEAVAAPQTPQPSVTRRIVAPVETDLEEEIPEVAEEPTAARSVPVGSRPSRAAVAKTSESSMKAELTLLEQARSQLRSGNASAALDTLSSYRQRHPHGNMGLEAEVLRVEALAGAGRTREAARLADRMLARHPKSVVATRLRRFASKD